MSQPWLHTFESRLQQLETKAAAPDAAFPELLQQAADILNVLAADVDTELWLVHTPASTTSAVRTPAAEPAPESGTVMERFLPDGSLQPVDSSDQPDLLAAIRHEHLLSNPADSAETADEPCPRRSLIVRCCLTANLFCLLRLSFSTPTAPLPGLIEGTRAVADMMANFVTRNLLTQYQRQLEAQQGLLHVLTALQQCRSVAAAATVIAQEAPAMFGNSRLTVLSNVHGQLRTMAITGVKSPNRDAETIRAIEYLAASQNFNTWQSPDELIATGTPSAPETHRALRLLQNSEVRHLRFMKIPHADAAAAGPAAAGPAAAADAAGTDTAAADTSEAVPTAAPPSAAPPSAAHPSAAHQSAQAATAAASTAAAVIMIEVFAPSALPDEPTVRRFESAVGQILQPLYTQKQPLIGRAVQSRRMRWLLASVLGIAGLATWPATFEIEVPGQIVSVSQQRIFAPEHGTIDEVLFRNEQRVDRQQPLLKMSNADLELELRRLQGEMDTAGTELAAVSARRLTTQDPQLSGEEERLKQLFRNLQQQRIVLQQRADSLLLTAPFAGTAFRHNAEQELMSRPVQRGQYLLELVPDDTAWQLELTIPDHLQNYVRQRRAEAGQEPLVRYVVRAAPEQDWTTRLSSVDNAVQLIDGQITCRGTAVLERLPDVDLYPGASVTARINCGRRSIGFVWFRELIEFWQQFQFAWL
ncbi:MAG: hypothetical protein RIK87_08705 [Fuerstiella sp.]